MTEGPIATEVVEEAPPPLPRRRGPRLRRPWRAVAAAAAVLVVLVVVLAVWAQHQISPPGPRGPAVSVDIPPGSSTDRIAELLAAHHVISHPLVFRIYVKVHGGGPFQAGYYSLPEHDSYGDVIAAMERGPVAARLTIPEGFTLSQIASRVGALRGHTRDHFLAVAQSGVVHSPYQPAGSDNLEGLLFPDTYQVEPGESDAQILQAMVDRFDQVAQEIGLPAAPTTAGVTPYQAVVVASMIEREAKVPGDRPLVAEVVYNRLAKAMRLQVDATVLYALGGGTTLTAADLQVKSPYNTYLVTGLPPGPIASPGRASLEAALQPAKGPYLYYVVVEPDGQEAFSATLAGQEANISLARSRGLAG